MGHYVVSGFGARRVPPVILLPGTAIMYGILRGSGNVIKECEREGHPYLYVDHAYFWQYKGMVDEPRAHFRIVKNGRYFNNLGDNVPGDRFKALGVEVKPWKKGGSKVVVVPLSAFVARYMGVDPVQWLETTIEALSRHTDRHIVVKPKYPMRDFDPKRSPFIDFIKDAHAVVSAESNVAVDAIVEGVPIFCSPNSPAAAMGLSDLDKIESPVYPDRENWLNMLAYRQFTIGEIASGKAREILDQT